MTDEEIAAHELARARLRALPIAGQRAELVKSGIYADSGELTENYRAVNSETNEVRPGT